MSYFGNEQIPSVIARCLVNKCGGARGAAYDAATIKTYND